MSEQQKLDRIASHPAYERLTRLRNRLSFVLTIAMLTIYFAYILLVAFAREWLTQSFAGGVTSIGIVLGLAVIACAIALTGIYVRRANKLFDPLVRELVEAADR